ncbi:MAG: biliverdin-producing heme oxygenase [Chitinophagales bacterium]|jgi:heme oxygenase|nr:biliverdin-producing heme oxygenase [Chitinophagales bacterium]
MSSTIPLKEATSEKHRIAEQKPFNQRMFRGQLTQAEYLSYLYQHLEVFQAIESGNLPHEGLARVSKIKEDIAELEAQGINGNEVLPATKEYAAYLRNLSAAERLPHIYLNYLAICYGGQMMKKVVPSTGKMYDFDDMMACVGSIRAVQSDDWADEVNLGFDYNIAIFDALEDSANKLQA